MPTEPLTDAELAELWKLHAAAPDPVNPSYCTRLYTGEDPDRAAAALEVAARNALPRLLDELELLRRRDREQAAGEEVLRQQVRDAERRIEMLRVELGQRGR